MPRPLPRPRRAAPAQPAPRPPATLRSFSTPKGRGWPYPSAGERRTPTRNDRVGVQSQAHTCRQALALPSVQPPSVQTNIRDRLGETSSFVNPEFVGAGPLYEAVSEKVLMRLWHPPSLKTLMFMLSASPTRTPMSMLLPLTALHDDVLLLFDVRLMLAVPLGRLAEPVWTKTGTVFVSAAEAVMLDVTTMPTPTAAAAAAASSGNRDRDRECFLDEVFIDKVVPFTSALRLETRLREERDTDKPLLWEAGRE